MNPTSPDVISIFGQALEIESSAGRAAYLQEACGTDADLRAEVEGLLAALGRAGAFMHRPAAAVGAVTAVGNPVQEGAEAVIGPYKLLQQIGEGGFGVVYMAEQEQPVRRTVALKIIKPGMDTAEVLARFESERQALALMDHPNIAKVLDAGATESGRPYFVMELVKGVPITDFCDKNHLAAEARLKLFIDVCHAIQHAHHKGLIHRDVKPSNVMVTLHDGVGVVKVIDFGVAKATVQKLTERTLFTAYGQMVGTPAYMSPEQAEMSGLDIDTRSDVYSLGVLLYELLTGTTPLEVERLRQAGYAEMQRMIREEEAPRPSLRMSSLGDSATVLAGNRGTEPKQLARLLAGDLDWIVMKALEKDRNRRYGTPGNFADDVERYLRREAIEARSPSSAYKLRKFAQRNRAAVTTATVVFAALLAGTAIATWQAVRARRAERVALEGLRETEQARSAEAEQRQRAEASEQRALAAAAAEQISAAAERTARKAADERRKEIEAVSDFMERKVIAAARPEGLDGGLGRDVTLRRAVEAAVPFVRDSFKDQPLIEARLRLTLGVSFQYLGEPKRAAEQFEAARALYTRHRGPHDANTLRAMHDLANSYADLGRADDALKLREETLALRQTHLGRDNPDTLTSMNALAISYDQLGRYADALKLQEETLARCKAVLGPDHPDTILSMQNLAGTYQELGRNSQASKLLESVLTTREARLGSGHADTLPIRVTLANCYDALDRQADALKLREETLARCRAVLGPEHPQTLGAMNNLASSYHNLGRHAEALKLREETLAIEKTKLGADHPATLMSMSNLANSFSALGRYAEAVKLREGTLALEKAKLGPDHPQTLRTMHNLANGYKHLGRNTDALKLREEMVTLRTARLGSDHPDTLQSKYCLATDLYAVGRYADALKLSQETLALQRVKLGADHPDTLTSIDALAQMSQATGKPDQALPLREESLSLRRKKFGPDHPDTLTSANNLSFAYLAAGARQAWLGQDKIFAQTCGRALEFAKGSHDPVTAERVAKLCSLRPNADTARLADSLSLARKAVELGKDHIYLPWFQMALGMAEFRSGHFAEADTALIAAMNSGKDEPNIRVTSEFYRAMCLFHRGEFDNARQLATEAASKMRPLPNAEKDLFPHDDLIVWLAYKEARDLLKLEPNSPAADRAPAMAPRG